MRSMMTYTASEYANTLTNLRDAEDEWYQAKKDVQRAEREEPDVGMTFRVVRGRKFPAGMTARATAFGTGEFGAWVRFIHEGQTQFISRRNVVWPAIDEAREEAYTAANDAEAAVLNLRKIVVEMAGIDLSVPLRTVRAEMAAYSDNYIREYACNPEAPDDVLRQALRILDPPESSWGQLRWSGGSTLHTRRGGVVEVYSSIRLCD